MDESHIWQLGRQKSQTLTEEETQITDIAMLSFYYSNKSIGKGSGDVEMWNMFSIR